MGDSKKRIKAATAEGLEHKLPVSHRIAIATNNALLAMYTNQVELCRALLKELADAYNIKAEDRDLITAGVLSRAGRTNEAVSILVGAEVGKRVLEKVLIASQIYLEKGQVAEALKLLDALPKGEKYLNGILSILVTLHLANGDRNAVAALLKDAVAWRKGNEPDIGAARARLRQVRLEKSIGIQQKATEIQLRLRLRRCRRPGELRISGREARY